MRAVRSTINAAGNLKRKQPKVPESVLVLNALVDINLPKFLKHDIPLFNNIISDLFPTDDKTRTIDNQLFLRVKHVIDAKHLESSQDFITKVFQMWDTLQVRHGLMLVGPTGSGKSCTAQVLKDALNLVKPQLENNTFKRVKQYTINPKSILNEQIYGKMNQITKEYTKGIVPALFNKAVDD